MNDSVIRLFLITAALTLVAAVATACGDDGDERALAPELDDGVLQVGSNIAYAPIEFFEGGSETPVGLDIDLTEALASSMGVRAEFQNMGFDTLIPALQDSEIDVIMSAMTISRERSQEIDFVAYLSVGSGILVAAGNPEGIGAFEDLCGLKVAVQKETIQVDQVNALNEGVCLESQIDLVTFSENPLAVEQLRVDGADAVVADDPVVVSDARLSEGQMEMAVVGFEPAPYGIGVRKNSSMLKTVIEEALAALIEDGIYADILGDWGLSSGSLE